jgi:RHS repeat-associated protein
MDIPGRTFTNGAYRFGYQGSLKANELGANQYTTYFRELDSRIMRWWSPDPVYQPWQSPYTVNGNNPICLIDPMGDKEGPNYSNKSRGLYGNGRAKTGGSTNKSQKSPTTTHQQAIKIGAILTNLVGKNFQADQIKSNLNKIVQSSGAVNVKVSYSFDLGTVSTPEADISTKLIVSAQTNFGKKGSPKTYLNYTSKNGGPLKRSGTIKVSTDHIEITANTKQQVDLFLKSKTFNAGVEIDKGGVALKVSNSIQYEGVTYTIEQTIKPKPKNAPDSDSSNERELSPNVNWEAVGISVTTTAVVAAFILVPEIAVPAAAVILLTK